MACLKLAVTLLCVFLLSQQISAEASNKQSTQEIEDTKDDLVAAEDRISDSYLPPPSSRYNGPKPVYGPPELTGVQPQQVYDAPPAEQPPPRSNAPIPFSSYGPPSKPKPQYGAPKPQYRPSKPKPQYGPPRPPKPQYGPPKPQYGPPRPPKPQYGPPKPQYGPPKPQYGPPKPEYGPPKPKPHDTYGPPPQQSQPSLPQQQYGAPNNDLYGPPPPPPPGVAAPPTPPEIKYDGWQPIAGQAQRPSDNYGPPPSAPSNEYGPPQQSQPHQEYGPPPAPSQPARPQQQYGAPSDEYGPPPPPSQPSFPPRQSFRPPSDEYGPPPPPSQPSFPPRQQYGPPSKPHQTYGPPPSKPHQEYGPPPRPPPPAPQQPSLPQQQYGPPANEYGPPPRPPPPAPQQPSLPQQQYGPPANEYGPPPRPPPPAPQQPSLPQQQYGPPANEYGPPPRPPPPAPQQPSLPQQQYGPPANEYGPPPPAPQQPSLPQQQYGPPANEYGPPPPQQQPSFPPSTIITDNFAAPKQQYIPSPVQIISDPKVPSDSYGTPLNNPEDHNLKSTVSQSTKTHDGDGLPPPDLPLFEPLHNNQGPIDSNNIGFGEQLGLHTDNLAVVKTGGYHLSPNGGRPGNSYAPPSFNDLSIQQLPAPSGGYSSPAFGQGNNYFNRFNRKGNRRGPFPPAPNSVFTPPRRPPTQFRESIPKGVYNSPQNTYAPPANQAYPISQSSVAFFGSQNFLAAHPEFLGKSNNFGPQSTFGNYNSQASYAPSAGGNSYNSLDSHLAASIGSVAVQGVNDCDNGPTVIYQQNNEHVGDSQSAYSMPNVSELELQNPQQQQQNHDTPKDSYGNPISDNFGAPDQSGVQAATSNKQQQSTSEFSDGHSQNSLTDNYDGLTAEQLTAALTAQGYGEAKNIVKSSEIDSAQYLASSEGQQALGLTQASGNDGFQIQGSQGTYTLQIQAADGHFNTDNSNGDIRHEQILSNGLLQNILAAIEQQPEGAQIELHDIPESSAGSNSYDLSQAASSSSVVTEEKSSSQSAGQKSSSDQESSASSNGDQVVAVYFDQAGEASPSSSRSGEKQEQEIASSDKDSTENMKSS